MFSIAEAVSRLSCADPAVFDPRDALAIENPGDFRASSYPKDALMVNR